MAFAYMDKETGNTKYYTPPRKPSNTLGMAGAILGVGAAQKYPQKQLNTGVNNSANPSYTGSAEGLYNRLLRQQQQAAEHERRAQQEAANKQATYQSGQAQNAAAGSRTNEYIYNQLANRDMGQQASLMGLGGLSESTLAGQQANYQNNLSGIDRNLNTELGSIENQRAQGVLGADKDYNTILRQISQDRAQSELQRMVAQQGNGSGGTSGGSQTSKPQMTAAQYLAALEKGWSGDMVDEAAATYGGINMPGKSQMSTPYVSNLIVDLNSYRGNQGRLAKIKQELAAGNINETTAAELMRKFGYQF